MTNRTVDVLNAIDLFDHHPDIIPNTYNIFAIDGRDMTPYLSPMGLILMSELISRDNSLEDSCELIMDSCNFVDDAEMFDFLEDTIWNSGAIEGNMNPLELALLDIAYFGDHPTHPNIPELIEWYDPKVIRVSKRYDEICQRLYQAANDWPPCTTPHTDRIIIILTLAADWYTSFEQPLDCNWLLNYVPNNYWRAESEYKLRKNHG